MFQKRLVPILLLLWLPLIGYAQKSKLEKKISKSYDVSRSDLLKIHNRYGDIVVNTWNQNKITVEVKVEAWGRNESDAQKLLDRVEIDHSQSGNIISFKTSFSSQGRNWWGSNQNKTGFEITYTVNMPIRNSMELDNSYGAIHIADTKGSVEVQLGYGRLVAGRMEGKKADLELRYSKASIKTINRGHLELRYTNNVTLERAGVLELNQRYSSITIDEVNEIDVDMGYSKLNIGKLANELDMDARYSKLNIEQVMAGFESVELDCAYTSSTIGFDSKASFELEADLRYGNLKSELSGFDMRKEIRKSSSSEFEGRMGKAGGGRVDIEASYGNITLK